MPVKLRLRRQGRKGSPYYHIVAADARSPRDGKYLEKIGSYNPVTNPASIDLDQDAALKWLKNGAQPTDTVRAILRYTGVNLRLALHKQGKSEEEAEKIFNNWLAEKETSISAKKEKLAADAQAAEQAALDRERKIREERAAALAAKNAPPAPVEEEAPAEEAAEAATEEAPAAEAEAPAAEAPAAEAPAEEAPAAEAEAPAKEEAKEEPAKEAEAPAEEEKPAE